MKRPLFALLVRALPTAVAVVLSPVTLPAQIHAPFLLRQQWEMQAEEQFQQAHFSMAAQSAQRFLDEKADHMPLSTQAAADKAAYYRAMAMLKADQYGCIDTMLAFLRGTANPAYLHRGAVALARYYFVHDRLAEAIPWYEQAGIANLDNQEIADAKFELAYCYFNVRRFDDAEPLFALIREVPGRYYHPGNYYYGLLSYNRGDYEHALKSFRRIDDLPEYKGIVPYYIAEIHYFKGDRNKALSEAKKLIGRKEKLYYDNELHLLAAQCLFEEGKYQEALPYFEHYYTNSTRVRKEVLYELAYCYYHTGNYKKAIEHFRELSNTRDELGQTAMYLLGDCYLKAGDKNSARNAFGICADMEFHRGQQEASLLLAGKLAYEMGYHDEASQRLRTLLEQYPSSAFRGEAKTIFSDLLAKTNNYAEAYRNLQDITPGDDNARRVYQKVAYGYAMLQLQAGDLEQAYALLEQSLQYPADKAWQAAASFWLSELAYRMMRYDDAIRYGEAFLRGAGDEFRVAFLSPAATPQHAYMNMGYAAMKLERFDAAQAYFKKAQGATGALAVTAILREADAAFMRKQYAQAITLYDKAIAADASSEADYARLQKSILLGLQQKNTEKIALLQSIVRQPGGSPYLNDARYELAVAYLDESKFREAIEALEPLTSGADQRKAPAAWLKTGFAWQELNEVPNAIKAYRQVITGYPASEERAAALEALRNLYIQSNQPEAYAQLLKEQDIPDAGEQALDSTYYAAAETQFAAGHYAEAKKAMAQYLAQYPNGLFRLKAHFYLAESHAFLKENKEALAAYDAVLSEPWNDFSESSAAKAAGIAYRGGDYVAATRYYQALREHAVSPELSQQVYAGLMRTSYQQQLYKETVAYADTLSAQAGVSDALLAEARLHTARALLQQGETEMALPLFRELSGDRNAAVAAEARYRVAEIHLKQNKLSEAEALASQAVKLSAGQDYWIVKSYILLGDVLARQKDYFNAKATLQSVAKNTKIPELKEEALRKLEEVKALEKKQSKLEE
jgi:tetratricopeptide (TPR) repeat protein